MDSQFQGSLADKFGDSIRHKLKYVLLIHNIINNIIKNNFLLKNKHNSSIKSK